MRIADMIWIFFYIFTLVTQENKWVTCAHECKKWNDENTLINKSFTRKFIHTWLQHVIWYYIGYYWSLGNDAPFEIFNLLLDTVHDCFSFTVSIPAFPFITFARQNIITTHMYLYNVHMTCWDRWIKMNKKFVL
jgi:hypothetical protein